MLTSPEIYTNIITGTKNKTYNVHISSLFLNENVGSFAVP